MTQVMGGEGFEDFAEADIVELTPDKELDEHDLIDMVNETTDRSRDPKLVAFTAKIIREGLEFGRKMNNHFLQNGRTLN
ncbi:hypothetical protein CDAR_231661 [Caerostris darwini]|uniref:Uncharacterized protein n=1 Tax=Caerostris darwini TaxID=1538125 RepID=A0AAV4X4G4_9ARAC|nr:hypothetical protein CDAR_231531 [Caerostris darwini]GIY90100.1 hypothetical protein CDAR_231661 [Caerostris darwini]